MKESKSLASVGFTGAHISPYTGEFGGDLQNGQTLTGACKSLAEQIGRGKHYKVVSYVDNKLTLRGEDCRVIDSTRLVVPEFEYRNLYKQSTAATEAESRAMAEQLLRSLLEKQEHRIYICKDLYWRGDEQQSTMVIQVDGKTYLFVIPKDAIEIVGIVKIKNSGMRGSHAK